MISIFQSIADGIKGLFQFLTGTIKSIILLISKIPSIIQFVLSPVEFIPDIFKPFIILTVAVSIILVLIGRER